MMIHKLQGKKVLIMAPIVAIVVALLLSLAMYPMAKGSIKEIPIAIVSLDNGVTTPNGPINAGAIMVENIQKITATTGVMSITDFKSEVEANDATNNGKYCATLIIPSDFSVKQLSRMSPKPVAPEIKIIINQGHFGQSATISEQALTTMIAKASENMRPDILKAFQTLGVNISAEQAAYYATPLTSNVEYVNSVIAEDGTSMANAHAVGALMTWIVSLVMSVILYMYYRKEKVSDPKESFKKITTQLSAGLVGASIAALTITLIITKIFDFDVSFATTFMFLWLAISSIIMLIVGVLRWTGIEGVALFVIIMFLSMFTAALPYEMLPTFWQDWIYPWTPIRFIAGGLKDIFFISGDWFNSNSLTLLVMGIISVGIAYLSLFNKEKTK